VSQFTYGTLGRNVLRGPGAFNLNLTLSKHFVVKERYDLEFRVDAFNLVNSAQFSNPDTNIGDPSFGQSLRHRRSANPAGGAALQILTAN
jgi:hypothetical protein